MEDVSVLSDNVSVLLEKEEGRFEYPEPLNCGEVLRDLSGQQGERIMIPLDIGEGIQRVIIQMNGESGDADLYLQYGNPPELSSYAYRPYVMGNEEEVYLYDPPAGRWFLMIHGYRDFAGVEVSVSCVLKELEESIEPFLEDTDLELALYYELSILENTNRTDNVTLRGQVLNRRGRQAFSTGQFDEAMDIWTEWMVSDPSNPRPVALVGDLYLRADEVDEAISYYRKSLEMQPGQLTLMSRLARILDVQAGLPEESRDLLNRFSRLFPQSPVVALAQAEWLIRRRRYEEAIGMIQRVIEKDPENLNAMSLLHPLLQTPEERYVNMLNMLRVGRLPGRETSLAFAIRDNDLLTKPESWVLMDFLENMAAKAATPEQRRLFSELLPRKVISSEDFRIGRMSTNWISSREETWSDDGSFLLAAEADQTEAFLRLVRSDAMHNAFVEAEIEDSRGFFWIYARRGRGNMVRFGFEASGQLYLQVWMNNHLVTNETRMWSRSPGSARLRLSIRGDGAMGYINGQPAFGSPVTIPDEMGLGWWGIAPWSAKPGEAQVMVMRISGGPLPARLVMLPQAVLRGAEQDRTMGERSSVMNWLDGVAEGISTLAPEWYRQGRDGELIRQAGSGYLELRLLARYYRMRLLPMVRVHSFQDLNLEAMTRQALEDKVDGFTLVVDRMPSPEWLAAIETRVIESGLTLHFVQMDPAAGKVSLREVCGTVGIFAGPRRVQLLPMQKVSKDWEPEFDNTDANSVLWLKEESAP